VDKITYPQGGVDNLFKQGSCQFDQKVVLLTRKVGTSFAIEKIVPPTCQALFFPLKSMTYTIAI